MTLAPIPEGSTALNSTFPTTCPDVKDVSVFSKRIVGAEP